ncbi:serine hydrolase domain-containing protein [Chitinophaga flava]|uniref:Beta-lactamase-related domain-containing protein n=1 Tax=Chitinophaga flava TaxID=2259036 RepID=A0A365XRG6_9BACT|nr:serine hydrolase domain-containing protein [Chitinophaga flava]RBL88949.1 hypothetical protein DF182_20605 [Chitinophaga flava]
MRYFPYLFVCLLSIGMVSCTKSDPKETTPVNPTQPTQPTTPTQSIDLSAVTQILNDSVPVRYNGKCYAIIHVNGKEVYTKGYGGFDGETQQPVASCSKWFAGAVVMSLVDEGKFKLSDTIGTFLPIFTTYGKGAITIAELMSLTSGFPGTSDKNYELNPLLTMAQSVDSIAKNVKQINPAGTFYYGRVSMHIAGRICEVVTGKSWSDLANQKIFGPCGMTKTDYGISGNPTPASSARTTPNDYIKFLDMLSNKGVATNGNRVLSEAAVTAMNQAQPITKTAYSTYLDLPNMYGIGHWRDIIATGDVLIESSSPGTYGSFPWINHPKNITGFIFTYMETDGPRTIATCQKIRAAVRNAVK